MVTRAESKQQTREALILAGMELFREQGLDGPSLDAICEKAGKTRGAFYVHFDDRESFQVAILERILTAYVSTIVTTADPAGDLARTIEQFVAHVTALTRGHTRDPIGVLGNDQLRLLLQGIHRSAAFRERFQVFVTMARAQLTAIIDAGQAGGTVRDDLEPQALATVLIGQVFGLMALIEATPPSLIEVEATVGALLALIQPPKAEAQRP